MRQLAAACGAELIELNFERQPQLATAFADNAPQATLRSLAALKNQPIEPGKSILFLDEIQAAPEILAKLRWFAEDIPQQHIIAAGSLLDFALAEHTFSMPVGRIGYCYVEPMSFREFLEALGETQLVTFLQNFDWKTPLPLVLHTKFLQHLKYYTYVGGMPAAVKRFRAQRQLQDAAEVHDNLLTTFRDDFYKYANRVQHQRLLKVLQAIPRQLGQKFIYSHIDRDARTLVLKQAMHLLTQARLAHTVLCTDANGIPLGACSDTRHFKMILLDVGLSLAALGLNRAHLNTPEAQTLVNAGPIAEQLVGQGLRLLFPPSQDPQLYYWCRQRRGAAAEVDYILQHGQRLIPIEVKAGATGTLKSLHQLMAEKHLTQALRFNTDVPSRVHVNVGLNPEQRATYELLSLPIYMVSETQRLLQ